MPQRMTPNARAGAIALAVFASAYCLLSLAGPLLGPMAFVSWLGFSFGVLCLCEELGPAKPLNRAGLIIFLAAFSARVLVLVRIDSTVSMRAELLFAFATMSALLLWSVALLHRPRAPRAVGAVGTALVGSTLALILSAHLLVGGAAIWGFGTLFAALYEPALDSHGAVTAINVILAIWSIIVARLMWTSDLRSGS